MTKHEYQRQVHKRLGLDIKDTPLNDLVQQAAIESFVQAHPPFSTLSVETRTQIANIRDTGEVKFDKVNKN